MKYFWIFCISILFLGNANAQEGDQLFHALSNGEVNKVAQYFAPKVEICYGDDVFFLPKSKAAAKLEEIIKDLSPLKIVPLHKGSSDNRSSKYLIGDMKSAKGRYRIFIFAKKRGGKTVVKEIRMEPL